MPIKRLSFSYDAICKFCGRRRPFEGSLDPNKEPIQEFFIEFKCGNRRCKKLNRVCFEMGLSNFDSKNGIYINR